MNGRQVGGAVRVGGGSREREGCGNGRQRTDAVAGMVRVMEARLDATGSMAHDVVICIFPLPRQPPLPRFPALSHCSRPRGEMDGYDNARTMQALQAETPSLTTRFAP